MQGLGANSGGQTLEFQFCLEIKMQIIVQKSRCKLSLCCKIRVSNFEKIQFLIRNQDAGAEAVAKTVYFSFVQKSRCRLSFRNQDANYRCVVRLGFQILRKFNFVQKSRCRGWGPTLGDNQAVAKTVNCRKSYAVFFKQN